MPKIRVGSSRDIMTGETVIAMGNAYEDVKQCADYVTKTVDEDGVAYALSRFF